MLYTERPGDRVAAFITDEIKKEERSCCLIIF